MTKDSLKNQFKRHFIAIISLLIAIVALSYDTWRNEETEKLEKLIKKRFLSLFL